MAELQKTIDGEWVPMAPHPEDIVECSDGRVCSRRDALADCRGGFHSTDDDRQEANVKIVEDVLNGVDEWVTEYCTENTDYADGYFCIVDEMSHDWKERIEEWVLDGYDDGDGHSDSNDFVDSVVEAVVEAIDVGFDCEPEYDCSEYACYSGPGCQLYSFDIGEHEEQVDISGHDELQVLHDQGILDDVLDDVNCDVSVNRSRRREKNEKTGDYEYVGRDTYMPYDHNAKYPCLMVYTMPGGQWHFVIPAERMDELVQEAIAKLNGCED